MVKWKVCFMTKYCFQTPSMNVSMEKSLFEVSGQPCFNSEVVKCLLWTGFTG